MSIADKLTTVAENVPKVYEAGKQAEYDAFWDTFQDYGKRTRYQGAFRDATTGWNKETFKPKYDIVPTGSIEAMFWDMHGKEVSLEMDKLEKELGIKFDFSNATSFYMAFADDCFWLTLDVIDMSNATTNNSFAFYGGYGDILVRINQLIVSEKTIFDNSTFTHRRKLTHMIVSGTIAQNGFNVQYSPLDYESLVSIKNALADKSQDASGTKWVITVGPTNKAKFTEADLEEIRLKGWEVN